jgi:hypothetical protein
LITFFNISIYDTKLRTTTTTTMNFETANFYTFSNTSVVEWGSFPEKDYRVYNSSPARYYGDYDDCIYTWDDFCDVNNKWCVNNGIVVNDKDENVYQPKQRTAVDDMDEIIVYQSKQRTTVDDMDEIIVYQPKQRTVVDNMDEIIVYQPKQRTVVTKCT